MVIALLGALFWFLPPIAAEQDSLYRSFAPLVVIKSHIQRRFVEPVSDEMLVEGAIRGMMMQLDPFSAYMSPSEYPIFQEQMAGGYVGIGVQFDPRADRLVVASPLEDSPAYEAGVRAGDVIVTISGRLVEQAQPFKEAQRLRGVQGSVAHFEVRRPPSDELIEFAVRREHIRTRSVRGFLRRDDRSWDFMIDPQQKIGYLRISEFWENTVPEFDEAVGALAAAGVRALVIDVRFNRGGDLGAARDLVDRFISEGVVVKTKNRREIESVLYATSEHTLPDWPVVVLVNGYSASASEILAGALQDHHRAAIVGQRTFGKGSVQTVIELEDQQSALRLTTAYYELPGGRLIHRRNMNEQNGQWGIGPDHVVKLDTEQTADVLDSWMKSGVIENGEPDHPQRSINIDGQLEKALQLLRGEP